MAVLPDMLASIPCGVQVVLVSNAGEGADSPLADLARSRNAALIINDHNMGFGVACNQGAAMLDAEFLLFLNPDTALAHGALDALVKAADRHPDAVAFNPRIASPSGAPLFKRNSHLFARSQKMPRGWPAADAEVTVLSGAAFFVRREGFEKLQGFDPAIFLYHEDDDLSLRLRNSIGKLMFVRDALVTHLEGRSSERTPEIAALKAWHMGRSRVYATRKHDRPYPFARALSAAIRQSLSLQVLLSKRKRAKAVAYFRGVVSAWKDGGGGQPAPQ
jgi:N-acetylglucosaminyl-diphospho-decaprenol L-rhamnosyltransferase